MEHVRNKNDLFGIVDRLCTSSVCRRVLQRHGGTLLGGFQPLLPSKHPGWVILVKSPLGKLWRIAIIMDRVRHSCRYLELDRIPWEHWNPSDSDNPLYAGDLADRAILQRHQSRREVYNAQPSEPDCRANQRRGEGDNRGSTLTADDLQLDKEGLAPAGE